ncbi:MAG: HAMP domain-containing sensor histidine kinase [Caldilineaceae bacterium]
MVHISLPSAAQDHSSTHALGRKSLWKTILGHFLLSHLLPWLIIVPVMGLTLVYLVETQVLLGRRANELASQAGLVAELAARQPEIWSDPALAQAFVNGISGRLTAPVLLFDPTGHLLAASNTLDPNRLASSQEDPELTVPVVDGNQQLLGTVRLVHELSALDSRLQQLRELITSVLAVGLLFGALSGWWLALRLERPIRQSAMAIARLSTGHRLELLPEQGPTELRLLARSINALVTRLQTLEQAQKRLLANLVHELGRPLGALQAATQALLDGADDNPALRVELLMGMNTEMATLQRLLEDMTEFHEQLLAPLVLNRRAVALSTWLPEMLCSWQQVAQTKGVGWQIDLPAPLPVLALDLERMGQALGNLVSNAIKYTPPGGQVTIAAGAQPGETPEPIFWLSVSDTGPGIPLEEQAKIFTPFYRSRSQRRFPQGMGLGLSIARDVIVAHGGRIEVKSTPGVGSCFMLLLPVNPAKHT